MKLKNKGNDLKNYDLAKQTHLKQRLKYISEKVQKRGLQELIQAKREINRAGIWKETPQGFAKVSVNVAGNRRGMSNVENPPSSERMRKMRAMRRFYNKQMPVLQCSTCAFSTQCPQFRAGYECAFLPFLNSHRIETTEDLVSYMKELLGATMRRAHLSMLMETLSGAPPSMELSEALNLAFMQLKGLYETMTLRQTASVEIETKDSTIIGRLFGGLSSLLDHTKAVQVTPIMSMPLESQQVKEVETPKNDVNLAVLQDYSKESKPELVIVQDGAR